MGGRFDRGARRDYSRRVFPMTPILSARNLRYVYEDGTVGIDDVSLEVRSGETVIVFGPNASGKTTLLLCLAGLLEPTSGSVTGAGGRLAFEDPNDQIVMPTVLEDVMFGPQNSGSSRQEATELARRALGCVDFHERRHNRHPLTLSAGEKKRVALASVIAMTPEILILDEPTAYLDPQGRSYLLSVVLSAPQAKVIATNDTAFALAAGGRAAFLKNGRIAASGSTAEIADRFNWNWG